MPTASVQKLFVWEDSGATLMARIVGNDNALVTQASISTITCKIVDTSGVTPTATPSITKTAVIFNALQTDAIWTADSTGYNFKHGILASQLPNGDTTYRVEYKFTPTTGEPFHAVFELTTGNLLGS